VPEKASAFREVDPSCRTARAKLARSPAAPLAGVTTKTALTASALASAAIVNEREYQRRRLRGLLSSAGVVSSAPRTFE